MTFALGSTGLALAVAASTPLPPPGGDVSVLAVAPVVAGSVGELSVTILETPERGTPIELRLEDDGLQAEAGGDGRLPDNRLGWEDVVDSKAAQPRLRATFVAPSEPGNYAVAGRLSYITCRGEVCMPHAVDVRWPVVVEAAPEPESPDPS